MGGTPSAALLLVYFLFLKSCIDFNFFLAVLLGLWDLGSSTEDQTHSPCNASAES